MYTRLAVLASAALLMFTSQSAAAPIHFYQANLVALNNSGVSGTVLLVHDANTNELTVTVNATGLEPNRTHPQHIHGVIGGVSVLPTMALDSDNDGYLEVAEGVPAYGPVILNLRSGGAFPTSNAVGVISFSETFDLDTTGQFAGAFGIADLLPLNTREVVLHGLSVGAVGVPPGEVDGTAGYKAGLPVAAGTIAAIPEPSVALLVGFGLVAVGGLRRLRRK